MDSNTLLGLSVLVCLVGIVVRVYGWFSQRIEPSSPPTSVSSRIGGALGGVFSTLFSLKFPLLIRTFLLDLLLQKRLFKAGFNRWLGHAFIFVGFIGLLFMHGLGMGVSDWLFDDYYSTMQPYLFLRNIFGFMVLLGVGMGLYRRFQLKKKRLFSNWQDWFALLLVATIIGSGFLLEGAKISSYAVYQEMNDEYGVTSDPDEEAALEVYWVSENGLHSPNVVLPVNKEMVEVGRVVNDSSCVICHSSNSNAIGSYAVAVTAGSLFNSIGDETMVRIFVFLHVLSFAVLIAYLPFSKMFHIFAVPLNLLINGVGTDESQTDFTKQIVGLSSCTHCGSCTVECSSTMFFETKKNDYILPSEKVQALKRVASGKTLSVKETDALQDGFYICTSCDRCTSICPSGINLKDLFVSARYYLLENGKPEYALRSHFSFPLSLKENYQDNHLQALQKVEKLFKESFTKLTEITFPLFIKKEKDVGNGSFKSCYSCQRCTNICPIVRRYDDPTEELDLLPHQIIFSLGTGNVELAEGSRMIWSCSTCYLCQEHCPNGVELTDIFYGLKNRSVNTLQAGGNA